MGVEAMFPERSQATAAVDAAPGKDVFGTGSIGADVEDRSVSASRHSLAFLPALRSSPDWLHHPLDLTGGDGASAGLRQKPLRLDEPEFVGAQE